jgi:tetrahydromethanopterin S-methyltransferase subunit C
VSDLADKVREEGATMGLAVVGVLAVVAVGFGIFLVSVRVLLPAVYPAVPDADPSFVAAVVGFVPATVYGVAVAVLIKRRIVDRNRG